MPNRKKNSLIFTEQWKSKSRFVEEKIEDKTYLHSFLETKFMFEKIVVVMVQTYYIERAPYSLMIYFKQIGQC